MTQKKVVIIFSGGVDSTTLLYQLNQDPNYKVIGVLTFDYGQRHLKEIKKAQITTKKLKLKHHIVDLANIKSFLKGSALTDKIKVPKGHYKQEDMKLTVVPFRNMIMLSIASAYAVTKKANCVACAVHEGDHFIYWDCRTDFIQMLNTIAQRSDPPVEIIAPYVYWNKEDIVRKGIKLGVPYEDTWTCYVGREKPCEECGACVERAEAFKKNKIKDPLL